MTATVHLPKIDMMLDFTRTLYLSIICTCWDSRSGNPGFIYVSKKGFKWHFVCGTGAPGIFGGIYTRHARLQHWPVKQKTRDDFI